ncbi:MULTISPECIES: cysteine desulfurase [Chromohalobacter]|jgi:cysteine desulfurase/selenocysteine lyase|uniref:Cysteine desulfurase n=1 Tax=Chromohalobacter israelensis (strain ATCC BAA-138 / DSM 3043 / CIP 106854 / NCIMB 13768 / 1H11) TaxID=290398 RepID=Q1QY67_CHRI1|nr:MULTISPECIES: cysteine desulfurase [Chromohalobacter]ABE58591.1 cysteine desulfurase / L-selenocysteine selenide-lyase (L-alanine-forming) [Chromohalobacter salexigens DSM 3043]NWO54944.1 cysteine desulfurase [Chromohalobacter salexigens]PWW41295.1 cysteine desulfurase /L-selenocysteine selenide-lyase (L-alanine-forming) [Chromohalobacter salexigens]
MNALSEPMLDVARVRRDFPILEREVHGKPLIYLDNAATTQTPSAVIETLDDYYRRYNANIHRGLHTLADEATAAYEGTRDKVRAWLGAASSREIIFTRGTTEAINLVANSWGRANLRPGDEILVSLMEHHSNIVPWQMLAEALDVTLKVIPVDERGVLDQAAYRELLGERTRLVCVNHVSNALGTVNPVAEMAREAHAHDALILVDGAQAVPHQRVDVHALGVDFYAFSGHKMYGPTGVGVLYGREALLEAMPPWQGGGEMISRVSFDQGTVYSDIPHKFEAGTPAIAEVIALGAALDWVAATGIDMMAAWEGQLLERATAKLRDVEGLRLIGTAPDKVSVLSFVVDGVHAQDIGLLIDQLGVAIRTGHHCAQPVLASMGLEATCRASLAAYNTPEEVDAFVEALEKVIAMVR